MRFTMGSQGRALALLFCLGIFSLPSIAQPAGWTYVDEVRVFNSTAQEVEGYQLPLELDAAGMASLGQLRPDAGDLRFGLDIPGTQSLPYWVQSGIGTQRMLVWVRLPRLAANGITRFYIYRGNPAATNPEAGELLTTLSVFSFNAHLENNTATLQRGGGKVSMAPYSLRGVRFQVRQDLLVVALGKYEPQGTTRLVTLWDIPTRSKLLQLPVDGPAGQYAYAVPSAPVWLTEGGEYMLTLQQGANEGYYYQEAMQTHPAIEILGARYCNGCDANTFPTLGLPGMQYGYPDIMFLTRKQIAPEPNYEYENIIQPPDPVTLPDLPGPDIFE